jgi:translation initiation factor IF-2
MSDDDNQRTRKPLGLKRSVDAGEVKQTFSHGRTNKVVVEVKRRRVLGKPGSEAAAPPPAPAPAPAPEPTPAPVAQAPRPAPAPAPPPPPPPRPARPAPAGETPQERVKRLQLEAEEERLQRGVEARQREELEAREREEEERRRAEENRAQDKQAEIAAEQQRTEVASAPPVAQPAPAAPAPAAVAADAPEDAAPAAKTDAAPAARRFTPVERPEAKRPEVKGKKKEEKRAAPIDADKDKRRSGKLTVTRALNEDEGRRARSLAALKRAREKERRGQGGPSKPREKQVRDVVVPEAITVGELANRMAEKGADLVKALFNLGMMVTVNQTIDQDTAELLVEEFGHNITRVSASDVDIIDMEEFDNSLIRKGIFCVFFGTGVNVFFKFFFSFAF